MAVKKKKYFKTICDIWQDKSDTCIDIINENTTISIIKSHNEKIHITTYTADNKRNYDTWILASIFLVCCIPIKTMGRVKS